MQLPEKIDAHAGSGQWRTTINQLIDYLEEKQWQFDNEYARGYNDGAYEQKDLEQRASLLKNATYTSDEGWHITLPKPEWWDKAHPTGNEIYLEALETVSKASGITFLLED